jgi:hypothetical protein
MAFFFRCFAFCGIIQIVQADATTHQVVNAACENGACSAAGASMLQHTSLDNGQSRVSVKSIPGASPSCPECECSGKKDECPVCPGGYEENVGSYELSIGDIRADDTTLPLSFAGELSFNAATGTRSHVTASVELSIRNNAQINDVIARIESFLPSVFNGSATAVTTSVTATATALTISAAFDVPRLDDPNASSNSLSDFFSRGTQGPFKIKAHAGSAVNPTQLLDAPAGTYDISADAKFAESLRVEYNDAFWEYISQFMGTYEQQLADLIASGSGSDVPDPAPAAADIDEGPLATIKQTASYKALKSAYDAEIASTGSTNYNEIESEIQLQLAKLIAGAQYSLKFGSLTNLLRAAAGQRPRLLLLLEAASPRVASWLKSPFSLLTSWDLAQFKQLVWGPILNPPAKLPNGQSCSFSGECDSGYCEYGASSQICAPNPSPTPPTPTITETILATDLPLLFQTLGGVLSAQATIVQPTWSGQATWTFTGLDRIVEFLPDEWIQ